MIRAVWQLALTTFVPAPSPRLGLFVRATSARLGFLADALLKPIFPNNVGLIVRAHGKLPIGLGAQFPRAARRRGATAGYWIIPICLFCGLAHLRPDAYGDPAVSGAAGGNAGGLNYDEAPH